MSEKNTLKPFLGRVLEMANESGDKVIRQDAAGVVAQLARINGELVDLTSGRRDVKKHEHHPIENLKSARRKGIFQALDILSESLRSKE